METSEDKLLDGRVILRQPLSGYRAGLDAALLAAACDAPAGARVIEAGCGVGAALLAAAARRPDTCFLGLERDPSAVELARANIAAIGWRGRVEVLNGEVESGFSALRVAPFDAAMANPPYFDDEGALRGPAPAKRAAWIAESGLSAWTMFLLGAVRDKGTVTVIHRADRLADLLALLAPRAGSFQVRPIQPFADQPAKRVLIRAVKAGKAPLRLLPPLVLHGRDGAKHTAETETILRGDAALAWK